MNSNTLQSNTVKTGQLCWFVNLFRLVETEFIATGGIEVPFKTSVEYLSVGLDKHCPCNGMLVLSIKQLSWNSARVWAFSLICQEQLLDLSLCNLTTDTLFCKAYLMTRQKIEIRSHALLSISQSILLLLHWLHGSLYIVQNRNSSFSPLSWYTFRIPLQLYPPTFHHSWSDPLEKAADCLGWP